MDRDQIFIFTGPTISPDHARQHLDAHYLPPVKLGDIYRISELYAPRIIGIIDGYFNQVPAVWHKEIQHVISQGIIVFGAASMGALRAAELGPLGMVGCGKIYEAYQNGMLPPFYDEIFEDDDEVAVVHSPAELGYLAASDAMVNMRFSLAGAMQQGVIARDTCLQLTAIAKNLFYPDRNYKLMLEIGKTKPIQETQLEALRDWLSQHAVDQKQLDAIELLSRIKQASENPPGAPATNTPPFQHTSQWQAAIHEIELSCHVENPVLNELRLRGAHYFQALKVALQLFPPLEKGANENEPQDLSQHHRAPDQLNQVFSERWQQKHTQADTDQLSPMQLEQRLLKYLRQSDALSALEIRARDKQKKLEQLQTNMDSDDLSEIDRLQLCDWHFSNQLDSEMPAQIEVYAGQLGLHEMDHFYDMLLQEYMYLNSLQ